MNPAQYGFDANWYIAAGLLFLSGPELGLFKARTRGRSSHRGPAGPGVVPRESTAGHREDDQRSSSTVTRLVELRGFEPLTPSMRTRIVSSACVALHG
jgi:hypothetical protein